MRFLALFILGIAVILAGCTGHSVSSMLEKQPDMRGNITNLKRKGSRSEKPEAVILVEATEDLDSNYPKASIRITTDTHILDNEGSTITLDQLREQQKVDIWFDGPVKESYPIQAQAAVIRVR